MPLYSVDEWSANSPHLLVAGDGSLAAVLGHVLGASVMSLNALDEHALEGEEEGESYRLLEKVHSIMIIVPLSAGLTDVARWVDQIWGLVERLSSMCDQHDLRWVLVPVASNPGSLEEGLGAVLAVPTVAQLASHGYGIWCPQHSLEDLVRVWQSVLPNDLLTLRARRNQDGRRRVLGALLGALQDNNQEAVVAVAKEVATQFFKHEYLLDVFCRPPSHQRGSKLRRWLTEVVTHGVTPHLCSSSHSEVESWLLPELAPPP